MFPYVPADAPHADESRELATRAARIEGLQAGKDLNRFAGDCPFNHSSELQFACRTAWLRGFSEGRSDKGSAGPGTAVSAFPAVGDPATLRAVAAKARSRISPDDRARSEVSTAMLDLARELEALADDVDLREGRRRKKA